MLCMSFTGMWVKKWQTFREGHHHQLWRTCLVSALTQTDYQTVPSCCKEAFTLRRKDWNMMMLVQVLVFWCLFAVPDIVKRDAVISTSRKFYFDLETEDKYAENVCVHVCVCGFCFHPLSNFHLLFTRKGMYCVSLCSVWNTSVM